MKLEPANIVCPACGSGNYMRHLIGKNVGYLDMKCINCNSYFNFDELYKRRNGEVLKQKPMTNGDRIRRMTDEEIEAWYWWMHKTMMQYTDSRIFLHDWLREEAE